MREFLLALCPFIIVAMFQIGSVVESQLDDEAFQNGKAIIEKQGYKNVKADWLFCVPNCCPESYRYKMGFFATDKDGNEVEGCMCRDLYRKTIVRFNNH